MRPGLSLSVCPRAAPGHRCACAGGAAKPRTVKRLEHHTSVIFRVLLQRRAPGFPLVQPRPRTWHFRTDGPSRYDPLAWRRDFR